MDQLSRGVLEAKYNPEASYAQAEDLINQVSRGEFEDWLHSPCTKAVLLAIEGDLAGLFLAWSGGAYTDEKSVSATAQMDAKARGMLQCLDDISNHIRNLKDQSDDSSQGL